MHHSAPPPWNGYPPSSYPPSQHVNGHDSLALGAMMGRLEAGQERTIFVLELIHNRLVQNSEIMAARLPERKPEKADSGMTWKDWAQIAAGVVLLLAALAGKITWPQALGMIGKPLGL